MKFFNLSTLVTTAAVGFLISLTPVRAAVLVDYEIIDESPSVQAGITASDFTPGPFTDYDSNDFGFATTSTIRNAFYDGLSGSGESAPQNLADSITEGFFFEFTMTGVDMTITDFDFQFGGERGGGGNTAHTGFYSAQYSLDGFSTAGTQFGTGSRANNSNSAAYTLQEISVSDPALTNYTGTITFRIYSWDVPTVAPSSAQQVRLFDVQVLGTAIPEPTSTALFAAAGLLLVVRHRRKS
ncbi:MAG: PEP-CTERM sorting domain-containing protein [Verrucomicrobiota bacterium]